MEAGILVLDFYSLFEGTPLSFYRRKYWFWWTKNIALAYCRTSKISVGYVVIISIPWPGTGTFVALDGYATPGRGIALFWI